MYSKVYDERDKLIPFPRSGFTVLLGARCPGCGGGVARVVGRMECPDPDWDPGDVPVRPLRCCREVWPTEVALLERGRPVALDPLSGVLARDPNSYTGNFCWSLIVLDSVRPSPARYRVPPGRPALERWAERAEKILSRSRFWPQEALRFVYREGEEVARKRLWADLWDFMLASYRAAKEHPAAAPAVLALYRALYRMAAGQEQMVVGLEGGVPITVDLRRSAYAPDEIGDPLRFAWPWDTAAFTFGLWGLGEVETAALGAVYTFDLEGGEPPTGHWERVRDARRYTLTPSGVRAVLREGGIREVFLREAGPTLVYFQAHVDGLPRGVLRGWFDWEEGVGFSPWQLVHGFRPADDPLLGLAAGLFAELVTAEPHRIAHKVRSGGGRVLPPGEGEVKVGPRVVYLGARGERGTRSVRTLLPKEERRAPRPHTVAGHLRRISGRASEAARRAAEEYRVVLPEGFTFVRPHVRGEKKEESR